MCQLQGSQVGSHCHQLLHNHTEHAARTLNVTESGPVPLRGQQQIAAESVLLSLHSCTWSHAQHIQWVCACLVFLFAPESSNDSDRPDSDALFAEDTYIHPTTRPPTHLSCQSPHVGA
jgi:hypothetical protein